MRSHIQETKFQQPGPTWHRVLDRRHFLPPQNQPESQMLESSRRTPILVYLPFVPAHDWQPLGTLRGFSPLGFFCLHLSPLSTELSGQPLCVLGLAFLCPKRTRAHRNIHAEACLLETSVSKYPSLEQAMCPRSVVTRCPLGYPSDITAPRPPVAASKGEGCCGLDQGFPR